jgi:hypothetical protein
MAEAIIIAAKLLGILNFKITQVSIPHPYGCKRWYQFLKNGEEEPIYYHGTGFKETYCIMIDGLKPGERQEGSGQKINVAFCSNSLENVQGYVGPSQFTEETEFKDIRIAIIIGCVPNGVSLKSNNKNYRVAESWTATCVWIREWGDREMSKKQLYNDYLFQWFYKKEVITEKHTEKHTEVITEKHTEVITEKYTEVITTQNCYYGEIFRDHPGGKYVPATHITYINKKGEKQVCKFCYDYNIQNRR